MKRKTVWKTYIAAYLVAIFLCVNVIPAGDTTIEALPSTHTLSPSTSFDPLVTIEKSGEKYVIIENDRTGLSGHDISGSRLKDDTTFLYISHLVGKALTLNIGPEILKELIEEHFSHLDISSTDFFGNYHLDRMWLEDGIYHIPYTRADDPSREQLLKYYLPSAERPADGSLTHVSIPIGDVIIILEDPELNPTSVGHLYTNIESWAEIPPDENTVNPNGITHLGYKKRETEAHVKLAEEMSKLGMTISIDKFLNTYGRYESPGTDPSAKPIRIISHLDSVPAGGKFDGTAGVLTGLEVIRQLHEKGLRIRNPIELVAYRCEESSRFGKALIGSTLATGKQPDMAKLLSPETTDKAGIKLANDSQSAIETEHAYHTELLDKKNIVYRELPENEILPPSEMQAVYEIHAEQGNILENSGKNIGIVNGIAAPLRFNRIMINPDPAKRKEHLPKKEELLLVTFIGQKDHSGATPMIDTNTGSPARKDALCAAAEFAKKLQGKIDAEKAATSDKETPGLVYGIKIEDASMNTIPGKVTLAIRCTDQASRKFVSDIKSDIQGNRKGLAISVDSGSHTESDAIPELSPYPEACMAMLEIAAAMEDAAKNTCNALLVKNSDPNTFPVGTIGEVGFDPERDAFYLSADIRGYKINTRGDLLTNFTSKASDILNAYGFHSILFKNRSVISDLSPDDWDLSSEKHPVDTNQDLCASLQKTAAALKISYEIFHSGASHDLVNFTDTAISLIFVPSIQGKSHNPEENTDIRDLAIAAELLREHLADTYAAPEEDLLAIPETEEQDKEVARNFVDRLKLYISELAEDPDARRQKLIIGIETDWVDALTERSDSFFDGASGLKAALQNLETFLSTELPELLKEKGLDNLTIIRAQSENLASELKAKAEAEKTSYSNIIAIGGQETVKSDEFAALALNHALIVGVNTDELQASMSEVSPSIVHVHLNIIEMLNAAVQLHRNPEKPDKLETESLTITTIEKDGNKIFIFMPKTRAYDYETLNKRYKAQIRAMTSA